jgi:CubicO group peptidase (beta-lactamase class C family)
MTTSSVKSWISLLAGMLETDGKLSLDDSVATYVPDWAAGARGGVTVRQLLTMTSGLARRSADSSIGVVTTNKNAFVTALPLGYSPGERWEYSNEGAQLLSPLLERAAGMRLSAFARQRLFAPLHMDHTRLHVDGAGVVWTYADAETTLRDFAKPCQLMLDGGRWNGTQVISPSWVQRSIQPIPQNPQYGWLWWLVPGGFAARGSLDTSCYVFPELGLVVARMQAKPVSAARVRYETPALFPLLRQIVGR